MGPHFDPKYLRGELSSGAASGARAPGGELVRASGAPAPMTSIPYRPQALTAAPNAFEILMALKRRWLAAVVVGLLCAAIVFAVMWYNAPVPYYLGASSIVVAEPQRIIGNYQETKHEFENFVRSQGGLIMSRMVLSQAARELAGAGIPFLNDPDPATRIAERVRVEFGESPDVIRIVMSGDKEEEIVQVVNAVTKAYLEKAGGWEFTYRNQKIGEQKEKLDNIEKRIRGFETQIASYNRKADTPPPVKQTIEDQLGFSQKMLADTRGELAGVLKKERTAKWQLGAIVMRERHTIGEEHAAAMAMFPFSGSPVNLMYLELTTRHWSGYSHEELKQEIDEDPGYKNYVSGIENAVIHRDAEKRIGTKPAIVAEMERQLLNLRTEFAQYMRQLRPQLIAKLRNKAKMDAIADKNKVVLELLELEGQKKTLLVDIAYYTEERAAAAEVSLEVQRLNRHIDVWQGYAETIKNRIDNMTVELDQAARVHKREDAGAVLIDTRPRHWLMTGVASGGALALVVLAFGWWEYRARKINSADEVVLMLGMRLLGALPDYTHRRRLLRFNGDGEAQWQHMLAESVDTARTMILHAAQTEGLRVVMVTSAMPGEGKTSSATHLAASLARAGRKTLLVDCDLRNPTAHRLFQMTRAPGFADVLHGHVELEAVVRETPVEGLSVITSGRTTAEAMQSLARGGANPLFQQLRQQFDFIIVDSAPVLPVADSLLLSASVDAVIFAVLRDVSRMPRVYEAYRRLAVLGVRTLGAMVSGIQDRVYSNGYSYAGSVDE